MRVRIVELKMEMIEQMGDHVLHHMDSERLLPAFFEFLMRRNLRFSVSFLSVLRPAVNRSAISLDEPEDALQIEKLRVEESTGAILLLAGRESSNCIFGNDMLADCYCYEPL